MRLLNFFKYLVSDTQAAFMLFFNNSTREYDQLVISNRQNRLGEVKRVDNKLTKTQKKMLFAQAYADYSNFLESIKSKEVLSLLIKMGLDLNKYVPSSVGEKIKYENTPKKAPAIFHILANQSSYTKFELLSWCVESGANLHAKCSIGNSFLHLLLAEYKYYAQRKYELETEKDLENFVSILNLMKSQNYNFSELSPQTREYVALDCMPEFNNQYTKSAPVFEFLVGEVKDINFAPLVKEDFMEGTQYVANTFFSGAAGKPPELPYVDILLEKYKHNHIQLQEFRKQLESASIYDITSLGFQKAQEKLDTYIERAHLKREVVALGSFIDSDSAAPLLQSTPGEKQEAPKKKTFKM